MADPGTRIKMAKTLRAMGHKPIIQGGNGRPLPEPQARLAERLGWETEVTVAIGDGERPHHYNIDIGSRKW